MGLSKAKDKEFNTSTAAYDGPPAILVDRLIENSQRAMFDYGTF